MTSSPSSVQVSEQLKLPNKENKDDQEQSASPIDSPFNSTNVGDNPEDKSHEALLREFKRLVVAVLDAMAQDRVASQVGDKSFVFSSTPLHAFANSENVSLESFKTSGGVRIIVLALKKHGSCSAVVHYGCQALITLMLLDGETASEIIASSCIAHLIATLFALVGDGTEDAIVAALKLLRNLAQAEEQRNVAFQGGGVAAITAIMRAQSGSPRTLSHAALLLANLAFGNAEIKEAVGRAGGLDVIAKGMQQHMTDHAMQARGSLALRNLCYGSDVNAGLAGEAGAGEALVNALRQFSEDREVAHQSCVALANMSNETEANRTHIVAAGGGPALIALLQRYPNSMTVADDAISVLRNIAVGSDQAQAEIGAAGGVESVVRAMERFRSDARVVTKCCAALRYICFLQENRERMGSCNGLQQVFHGLAAHTDNVETVEHALLAIGNSTFGSEENKEAAGDCGGIKTIIQAIEQHRLTASVQAHGCRVLRNLTDGSEENRRQAVEHRAITAGVFAMMGFGDNASVQEQACAMLLNIAMGSNYLAQLEQADVRRLAEKAIATHGKNRGVHLQAGLLLDRLNGFDVHGVVGGEAAPPRGRPSRGRTSKPGFPWLFKKRRSDG